MNFFYLRFVVRKENAKLLMHGMNNTEIKYWVLWGFEILVYIFKIVKTIYGPV